MESDLDPGLFFFFSSVFLSFVGVLEGAKVEDGVWRSVEAVGSCFSMGRENSDGG